MENFGEKLRYPRQERNLGQIQLAKELALMIPEKDMPSGAEIC